MKSPRTTTPLPRHRTRLPRGITASNRRGGAAKIVLGILIVLCGVGGALAWQGKIFKKADSDESKNLIFEPVKRGPLEITITERGNLESAQNSTIVCMVEGDAGVGILEIKDEGTIVKKGEVVVRLDSSNLNNNKQSQEITVEQAAATLKTAETNLDIQVKQNESDIAAAQQKLDLAKLDLEKYQDGDYEQELKAIKGEMELASEELTRAQDKYAFTARLVKKGYAKQSELAADKFAVQKAENSYAVSEEKMRVLKDYTKKRQMTELESNAKEFERELARVKLKAQASIAKYEADLSAAKLTYKVEQDKAKKILTQIDACTILAPCDGLVVYVNTRQGGGRGGGTEPLIYEGAKVKERQQIINLPDVNIMRVNARIHESKISMVREGLPATIHLDAKAGEVFHGEVSMVSLVSVSGNWPNFNLKEYITHIKLTDPVEKVSQLKPGSTAEVEILIDRLKDVLQLPVQSFVERGGRYFAWVLVDNKLTRREVKIGKSNEQVTEILEGLALGDKVAQTPRIVLPKEIAQLEEEVPATIESATTGLKSPEPGQKPAGPPGGERGGGRGQRGGSPGEGGPGGAGPVAGGPGGGGPGGGGGRGFGDPAQMFANLDKDSDGKLTEAEMPDRMKERFAAMDANKDGSVDQSEFVKAIEAFRAAGGGGGGGRRGGGPSGGGRPEAGGG